MAKIDEKLLAKYYDGALSPKQAAKVEQMLEGSPEDQESLARMSRMTDLLNMMNEETLRDVSFAGFEQRVAIAVRKEEKEGFFDRLKVTLAEFFEYRKVVWVPATAVAAVVLAAIVATPFVGETPATGGYASPHPEFARMETDGGALVVEASTVASSKDPNTMEYSVLDGNGNSVGVVWIVENQ